MAGGVVSRPVKTEGRVKRPRDAVLLVGLWTWVDSVGVRVAVEATGDGATMTVSERARADLLVRSLAELYGGICSRLWEQYQDEAGLSK
jgi:hypothetical protein